jgi:uncharacterized protein DUF4288
MRQTRSRRRSTEMPHRNQSHTGWWVASFIERLELSGEDRANLRRRCLAWENTILLRAPDRDRAYAKALRIARLGRTRAWDTVDLKTGRRGRWVFEGLTELLPVYEPLADGSEILWRKHRKTVRGLRKRVRTKSTLPVFDDSSVGG